MSSLYFTWGLRSGATPPNAGLQFACLIPIRLLMLSNVIIINSLLFKSLLPHLVLGVGSEYVRFCWAERAIFHWEITRTYAPPSLSNRYGVSFQIQQPTGGVVFSLIADARSNETMPFACLHLCAIAKWHLLCTIYRTNILIDFFFSSLRERRACALCDWRDSRVMKNWYQRVCNLLSVNFMEVF